MLRNFGWVLPGRLAGMARPYPGAASELTKQGVAAVLSLTEEPPLPELAGAGLRVLHVPVPDFAAPGPAALDRCVGFVRERMEAGASVVIHCHAGYGRTGTVLAACLVASGFEAPTAIEMIRRMRPGSIETPEQEDAVLRFAGRAQGEKPR
jgi:atypical dual specificity phosphatase